MALANAAGKLLMKPLCSRMLGSLSTQTKFGVFAEHKEPLLVPSKCLVVGVFEGELALPEPLARLDDSIYDSLMKVIGTGDFIGKSNTTYAFYPTAPLPFPRVMTVGLGKRADFSINKAREVSCFVSRKMKDLGVDVYSSLPHDPAAYGYSSPPLHAQRLGQALAEGTVLGAESLDSPGKSHKHKALQSAQFVVPPHLSTSYFNAFSNGLKEGSVIGWASSYARHLVNLPSNILTPEVFVEEALQHASTKGLKWRLLTVDQAAETGMGLFHAVAKGSANTGRILVLEYSPEAQAHDPPVVLVGKGITFDAGGISLKPAAGMEEMKGDMGGAAAVLATMLTLNDLAVPVKTIAMLPLAENMPSATACKPGDVYSACDGTTVEVINTDAEGRLVMADCLAFAKRFSPRCMLDVATLTGAIGVALGPQAAGVFSNSSDLQHQLLKSAAVADERLWPMPMYGEYSKALESTVADLKNVPAGPYAGVSTSAKFLEHFVGSVPWSHVDIACVSYRSEADPSGLRSKGPTGFGVRLLTEFLRSLPTDHRFRPSSSVLENQE